MQATQPSDDYPDNLELSLNTPEPCIEDIVNFNSPDPAPSDLNQQSNFKSKRNSRRRSSNIFQDDDSHYEFISEDENSDRDSASLKWMQIPQSALNHQPPTFQVLTEPLDCVAKYVLADTAPPGLISAPPMPPTLSKLHKAVQMEEPSSRRSAPLPVLQNTTELFKQFLICIFVSLVYKPPEIWAMTPLEVEVAALVVRICFDPSKPENPDFFMVIYSISLLMFFVAKLRRVVSN